MSRKQDEGAEARRLRERVAQLEQQLASLSGDGGGGSVLDDLYEGVQVVDRGFRYVYVNKTAARHGRRPGSDLIGRSMPEMYPGIQETELFRLLESCMEDGQPRHLVNHFSYPDGTTAWFDLRINRVPAGLLILSVDVSEMKAMEEQTRRSREDLAITLRCMADAVVTTDVEGRIERVNPAAEALLGWPQSGARGRPVEDLVRLENRRTGDPVEQPVRAVLQGEITLGLVQDTVLVKRDGTRVPISGSGAPMRDADGLVRGVVLVVKDMSREQSLTAMLQQSQKMEAVGSLAGGVAHDFNNLLTVISGYGALAARRAGEDEVLRGQLEEIGRAAERAASLTRQLLAFSRKQVLQPEVLDLNLVVGGMDKMLRRLIGEDIDLATRLSPDLDMVECDPGQIEQIIMNLAVNARDAMPAGGKLTLETRNVVLDEEYARTHPESQVGPHVMVAVTDTGHGMDVETLDRIFEPFFTTKGLGKGTGLGLSTVYGIVKQSGGNIWVYSEPGHGTTFKVYLPRCGAPDAGGGEAAPPDAESPRATETVLLVEDEPGVRGLIRSVLEEAGYTVLDTGLPDEALDIARNHEGEIHLLLTDVVLPRMGGPKLAEAASALRRDMTVVFMSGYTDDAIVHHGVLDPGTAFIEKPVTPDDLLKRLRQYLA